MADREVLSNPRLASRIELARHFNELGFRVGAEIGVADGRYSEILYKNISNCILYCIDPWDVYEDNWRSKTYQQQAYQKAEKRLSGYGATLIRLSSLFASLRVPSKSLDFVFIDGAHDFDNVMLDLILWTGKVRKGGIVSGHDYAWFTNSGVVQAVNSYVENNRLELNIIPRNEEPNTHKDDRVPCWWFLK